MVRRFKSNGGEKIQDVLKSHVFKVFQGQIHEILKESLCDRNRERVKDAWFKNRKRDVVVVASLFGLMSRSLRRRNLEKDSFCLQRNSIYLEI